MRNVIAVLTLITLAACSNAAPPDTPPKLVAPPEVATSGFEAAYVEQTIPMTVPQLRQFMDEQPLISFLKPTENIANPIDSEILQGTWAEPGAIRRLQLADGHYVIERILDNEPEFFQYQIFVFTNATGRGVEQIVGEQRFVPVEGGTRFEWTYQVLPKNFVTRLFVRRSMDEIETYISDGLAGFANAARAEAGTK